ncbi:hypothetical protein FQZ97_633000 [compost metagenome]
MLQRADYPPIGRDGARTAEKAMSSLHSRAIATEEEHAVFGGPRVGSVYEQAFVGYRYAVHPGRRPYVGNDICPLQREDSGYLRKADVIADLHPQSASGARPGSDLVALLEVQLLVVPLMDLDVSPLDALRPDQHGRIAHHAPHLRIAQPEPQHQVSTMLRGEFRQVSYFLATQFGARFPQREAEIGDFGLDGAPRRDGLNVSRIRKFGKDNQIGVFPFRVDRIRHALEIPGWIQRPGFKLHQRSLDHDDSSTNRWPRWKSQSRPGAALIKSRVYCSRGVRKISEAAPYSTTWPRCMTIISSHICAATLRS